MKVAPAACARMLTRTCSCPLGGSRQYHLAQSAPRLPIVRCHGEPGRGGTWRGCRRAKGSPDPRRYDLEVKFVRSSVRIVMLGVVGEVCRYVLCYALVA